MDDSRLALVAAILASSVGAITITNGHKNAGKGIFSSMIAEVE